MNKILKYSGLILAIVISSIIILIFIPFLLFLWILVLIGIGIFYLNKIYKKQKSQIPEDVLKDFEIAERRYLESNGQIEPRRILWDIAKSKSERTEGDIIREPRIESTNISTQPERRSNIQSEPSPTIEQLKSQLARAERDFQERNRKSDRKQKFRPKW